MSAQDAQALARCVMILDAVIRHQDHSDGKIHSWIGRPRTQPLKRLLTNVNCHQPGLSAFLLKRSNRGVTIDFELMLCELVQIWSVGRTNQIDPEHIRVLVNRYFPVAMAIGGQESDDRTV